MQAVFFELAKAALSTYFAYARIAGLDAVQRKRLYEEEDARFLARTPDKLTPLEEPSE